MIRFFRLIRKKLIGNNQIKKYLMYALGEIVLVVIGILIALQITNWNENRKDQLKEQKVLLALAEDFRANEKEISLKMVEIRNYIDSELDKLSLSGYLESDLTDEMKKIITGTGFVRIGLVDGTLNSILSTDKLELLKNDSLKIKLTAYPAYIRNLKKHEEMLEDYVVNKQRPIHRKYIALTDFIESNSPIFNKVKSHSFLSDYTGLLKNKEYFNITIGIVLTNEGFYNQAKILRSKTIEIINLVEKELDDF